jgi:hypothetical protein
MSAAELERDPSVQHVDVRLYFPAEIPAPDLLDSISEALQESPELCDLIAAYQFDDGVAGPSPLA